MAKNCNVLLINTDHWAGSFLGCAGNNEIMTPTIDQLAENGVRFSNCYSTCPVCIPARRSLMTGTFPRTHGDRVFSDEMEMPDITTMAQQFRNAGYQAYAVGKLHVYPQRNRIGFDDVILSEEARYNYGVTDDYQIWLGENGYLGKEYAHGMSNNQYFTRPWHLPEEAHHTNWATAQMTRAIKRRDPTRPAFFYISYVHPHPPLVPLQCYLDMYASVDIPDAPEDDWSSREASVFSRYRKMASAYGRPDRGRAKRAFYALCTHIDHQIRLLIGTLREEGLLDDTVVAFTSDHGDMLFDHGFVAKRSFYRNSTNVPLIFTGRPLEKIAGTVRSDLACLEDIMPTLLGACGVSVPDSVEGIDLLSGGKRELLYGEFGTGVAATRMVTDGDYKLIYYPCGNIIQLFDLGNDPDELVDISKNADNRCVMSRLTEFMVSKFYDGDLKWLKNGVLVGMEDNRQEKEAIDYGLYNQRGGHWPTPRPGAGSFV